MRALFSLAALLLVVWVVMKLSATQLQTLAPAAGTGASSAPNAAQQAADKVQRAIEQGAAQRAAEAASAGGR